MSLSEKQWPKMIIYFSTVANTSKIFRLFEVKDNYALYYCPETDEFVELSYEEAIKHAV